MTTEEIKDKITEKFTPAYCYEFFNNALPDYVSLEDVDEEEYEGPEAYYLEHCFGGAIEYDLLSEIRNFVESDLGVNVLEMNYDTVMHDWLMVSFTILTGQIN